MENPKMKFLAQVFYKNKLPSFFLQLNKIIFSSKAIITLAIAWLQM
jgi:hypothetical protein